MPLRRMQQAHNDTQAHDLYKQYSFNEHKNKTKFTDNVMPIIALKTDIATEVTDVKPQAIIDEATQVEVLQKTFLK